MPSNPEPEVILHSSGESSTPKSVGSFQTMVAVTKAWDVLHEIGTCGNEISGSGHYRISERASCACNDITQLNSHLVELATKMTFIRWMNPSASAF
ncbi:8-oxo-dGTP pyrophosphatase MutT and related house-cleaning NTP pyrophosphohydrolase [Pseudomonas syringae pv. actinidiae]|uniref:8-oxo-dGTP pyrophosphatase MutT and related house-cleaning NTP pyrophosphohydrolase n=1 Tax=Pseudomonas syringae pv. actinidiae TaxID=103796 RepID=A0AAN4Q5V5_PSESF|nr:8-oxo-dGTP pyrophosphatase MutT and related house-cleaning NTP pyrophosphohydrolase [Pseudomonas syringae pv. actinidiae]